MEEQAFSIYKQAVIPRNPTGMPFVKVAPGGRYFMTADGAPFLVVGHNDSISWLTLDDLWAERDVAKIERYIAMLVEHGVTVLRIMLEYAQEQDWFFEDRAGKPLPESVLYWDDLIGLCERHGLRLLVQFWDTFFMSRRWEHHPYSAPGTGFDGPGSFCTSHTALEAQKRRIHFFIERWGDSPAIFAYDLLNEIHPYWGGAPDDQARWLTEIARFTRRCEIERWGKSHLLTVSIFGAKPEPSYNALIFRHPEMDFVCTHVYEYGLVDNPENTIDCAFVMRDAVRHAYSQIEAVRPYTDTESGPIHLFMDLHGQLEEPFESEYYHNMSWGHLASGGAGSGMRWPFRIPHCLTAAMHDVQQGMARIIATTRLDWLRFSPRPCDDALRVVSRYQGQEAGGERLPVLPFGCADGTQALCWLLRDHRALSDAAPISPADLLMPPLQPGEYRAEFWETYSGEKLGEYGFSVGDEASAEPAGESVRLPLPAFGTDLAITVAPA